VSRKKGKESEMKYEYTSRKEMKHNKKMFKENVLVQMVQLQNEYLYPDNFVFVMNFILPILLLHSPLPHFTPENTI